MRRSSGRETIQPFNGLRNWADINADQKMDINEEKRFVIHCDLSAPQTSTPRDTCCIIKAHIQAFKSKVQQLSSFLFSVYKKKSPSKEWNIKKREREEKKGDCNIGLRHNCLLLVLQKWAINCLMAAIALSSLKSKKLTFKVSLYIFNFRYGTFHKFGTKQTQKSLKIMRSFLSKWSGKGNE